jgi:tRNA A-37 threonylcarbamoyl transferase component Bud32
MIFSQTYKHIEYKEDTVIITHYILDEYEQEIDSKDYETFTTETLQSYELAQQLNYCKILNIDDETITIEMERYQILYDSISNYVGKKPFIKKFCKLLDEMYTNNIVHLDLAPRNIGIDKNGDFKLIDLNDIYQCNNKQEFIKWLKLSEYELIHTGLSKKYNKACDLFIENKS